MKCPKCGTENAPDAVFCKKDRYPLGGDQDVQRCERGHILDPSWDYCHWCHPDGKSEVPQNQSGIPAPTVQESQPQQQAQIKPTFQEKIESSEPPAAAVRPVGHRQTKVSTGEEPEKVSRGKLVGWLVSFSRKPEGESFELRIGKHMIGADSNCDICIPGDATMSGEHAMLLYRNGNFILDDNMSKNGTFITQENGEELEVLNKIMLKDHLKMRMGQTEFQLIKLAGEEMPDEVQ